MRRRTVLFVDDEENILHSFRRLFRRAEYATLFASSGAEALRLLAAQPVDVIFSDYRMPGMNGVEFLARACAEFPRAVRILLTGYADLPVVTSAINEGQIYKFVSKPWKDEDLRALIDQAFRRVELEEQNRELLATLRAPPPEALAPVCLVATVPELPAFSAAARAVTRTPPASGGFTAFARAVLARHPAPVVGLTADGQILFANAAARELPAGPLVEGPAPEALRRLAGQVLDSPDRPEPVAARLELGGRTYLASTARIRTGPAGPGEICAVFFHDCPKGDVP